MQPKTKIEKEVYRLSRAMKPISEAQKQWALSFSCYERARRYQGRMQDIYQVLIATTNNGWQVIRHYYVYAHYRYKKFFSVRYRLVMEEWLKEGHYVFMCLNRYGMTYYNDAWVNFGNLEIRRGELGGWHCDPRELGYEDVLIVRLQDKYKYLPKDDDAQMPFSLMCRAVNTHPYNETLLKQNLSLFKWSRDNRFLYDTEKTTAIKIAQRYRYKINDLWKDMIDSLAYLGKDLHNPTHVCPIDLNDAHDRWCAAAGRRRRRISEKMTKLRQLAEEKKELIRLQREVEREEQRKKEAKAAIPYYKKMREKFFGLVIAQNDIEIKVLQSVQEFMEEGKEMQHCVFSNAYYDVKKRPACLILSAKVNGMRTETIEVDLHDYKVVQCRGKHNSNTPYHEQILNLMNENMEKIKDIDTHKANNRLAKEQKAVACTV